MLEIAREMVGVAGRLILFSSLTFLVVRLLLRALPKVSPPLAYALWGLVLLRLVLPPDFALPISLRAGVDQVVALMPPLVLEVSPPTVDRGPNPRHASSLSTDDLAPLGASAMTTPTTEGASWPLVVFWTWLAGLGLAGLVTARKWRRVLRIAAATERCRDRRAIEILSDWVDYFGIRRSVQLRTTDRTISPFTLGWWRPVVFVPETLLAAPDDSALEAAIAHELAHVKRFDVARLSLRRGFELIWFFYPVVWWTVERIDLARESLCDRLVTARGSLSQHDYARGLLSVVRTIGNNNVPQPVPALLGPKRRLHMRIESILNTRHQDRGTLRHYLAGAVAGIVGMLLLPMAGTGPTAEADDPPEAHFAREITTIQMPGEQSVLSQPNGPMAYSPIFATSEYLKEIGTSEANEAVRAAISNVSWVNPLPDAKVSSGFGFRPHPGTGETKHHDGVDLVAPLGTTIRAAGSGRISRAMETKTAEGTIIVIDHGDGLVSKYTHLGAIYVKAGQTIEAGDEIGEVGLTGETTGPHLHVEVRLGGHAIDPSFLIGC